MYIFFCHRHKNRIYIPALPFCKVTLKAKKPISVSYPKILNTLGDHIRKRRLDLKLLQKEVAKIIGISKVSIFNWENNRISPSIYFIPKIIKFLGYYPYDSKAKTLGEKIKTYRFILGLGQKQIANLLDIDVSTIGHWERGKNKPQKKYLEKLTKFFITHKNIPIHFC